MPLLLCRINDYKNLCLKINFGEKINKQYKSQRLAIGGLKKDDCGYRGVRRNCDTDKVCSRECPKIQEKREFEKKSAMIF